MPLSPTIEKIRLRDHDFSKKIKASVNNIDRCYQCSMCSDGCPVAFAMDFYPNQIVYMARMGLKDMLLRSSSIWICASCETCATRCPNEIEIVRLMDVLRSESLKGGYRNPRTNIIKFHRTFVSEIRKKGRVDEVSLLLNYELKTGEFLSFGKFREEVKLGLEMFRKGKLKLPSTKKHAKKAIREIFKVLSGR